MRASHEQQLRLLDLAQTDTALLQLRQRVKTLPQRAEIAALAESSAPARAELLAAQRDSEGVQGEIAKIESDITTVRARIVRNETQMETVSDAKLAGNLSSELEHLRARLGKLEDAELELMEQAEGAEARVATSTAALDRVAERIHALEGELRAATGELETEIAEMEATRENIAAEIAGNLLSEYEQLRQDNGIGAALLRDGVSEASNMKLSPGELAEINAAAADEVVYCPQTGVILIRK